MSIGNKETKSVEGLLTFLGERPAVFDVGSNKGQWTDIILNRFGDNCELHLFEPNKILLDYCRIKYEYKTNVTYNEVAAYKENTTLKFHYFENFNNELSSIYKGNDWEQLPMKVKDVTAFKIDTYCNAHSIYYIDYLKVDCEGSDPCVLQGAIGLMKGNKIGIIQIEYGEHYKRGNHSIKEIFDICSETGYSIYRYENNNWNLVEPFEDTWEAEDFFLTKFDIHNYSIKGWNQRFIDNTQDLPKFDFILEVGAFEGLTTKYICDNMLNEGGRCVVVDPLFDYYHSEDNGAHPYFKDQYKRFLRNTYGLPVELIRGKSEDELPKLNAFRYDFIYVDGDHRAEEIYHDCVWAFAITKTGGYILIDDVNTWAEPTREAVYKFLNKFRPNLEIVIESYQVLIKKLGDQYTELTYEYYK